jgi:hypothetical protein
MEEWRKIEGFEQYEVSSEGRVRSLKRGVVRPAPDRGGYLTCSLWKDGKGHAKMIHRLVALTFISQIEGKPLVDHINRNKLDNTVSNLRWSDRSEQNINRIMPSSNTKEKFIYKLSDSAYRVRIPRNAIDKSFNTLEEAVGFRDSLV